MSDAEIPHKPGTFSTLLIDPALRRSNAIVAALMGTANAAMARIADGEVWEDERDMAVDPDEKEHAERMAQIWRRAAEHLERQAPRASGSLPPCPTGPAKRTPFGFHTDP